MSKSILIIGGSGRVALSTTHLLLAKSYTVHSLIRNNPTQASSLSSLGAHPITLSLATSTVQELASTIEKCNPAAIVFAAGSGKAGFADPTLIDKIDRDAAIKLFDAMVAAGPGCTKRLIVVSVIDSRDRNKTVPKWYDQQDREASDYLWGVLPAYMAAKFEANRELVDGNAKRGLEYTIVRPTWYSEDAGTGAVAAGRVHWKEKISREDTAAVVAKCIEDDRTIGLSFDVSGGDVPIAEAVEEVGRQRVDCFEEYH